MPIPVAARSKVCVNGRSQAGIAGSNPARSINVSLFEWIHAECGVSECDCKASIMRRP